MVGCAIVSANGELISLGHHERFGGPHAEVNALRRAGSGARGATVYVTLEPCNHFGKTPPCTEAIINAGVRRVVYAMADPHPVARGGAATLQRAGIEVVRCDDAVSRACNPARPWATRLTGRPFVIAKWAETAEGSLISQNMQHERWISSATSRAAVHRMRGRVDVILTGIGTVLADDPLLTARTVHVRRVAQRVVLDSNLRIPMDAQLVGSVRDAPTDSGNAGVVVMALEHAIKQKQHEVSTLRAAGVEVVAIAADATGKQLSLPAALRYLAEGRNATTLLTEAGPRLLQALRDEKLIDINWRFIAQERAMMETADDHPQRIIHRAGDTIIWQLAQE